MWITKLIQSMVADAVSRALDHLYEWPGRRYKIALQIHDAVILETPVVDAEYVCDVVLPTCMTTKIPIYPTDLDGCIITTRGPYYLGIDTSVMLRWGETITNKEEALSRGVPERFIKKKK